MANLDVEKLIYGYGTPDLYKKLMNFMDRAFNFEQGAFDDIHPKLYKFDRKPWENNYMARDEENIYAAIGVYENVLHVGEDTLTYRGIGNVAVAPETRCLGLMKRCMSAVLKEMDEDGIDLACLGGHRQRYAYHGFQRVGEVYNLKITASNLRHIYAGVPFTELTVYKVRENDTEILKKINELHLKKPVYSERPEEILYDILVTWDTPVYAMFKEEEFIGYYIGDFQELNLVDMKYFDDALRNYIKLHGEADVKLAPWETEYLYRLKDTYENYHVGLNEMVHVFNYRKVIEVLLKFKSTYMKLQPGEMTLFIHGFIKDQKLKINVSDEGICVEDFEGECDLELSHTDAMNLLFGPVSAKKGELKPAAHSWLPLPIYFERADHV